MSDTYYPNATIPTKGTSAATWMGIATSTNTAPISVFTLSNHDLATGDCVEIVGHEVNTTANGTWQVTVVTSNEITLNGSSGIGVGSNTGNVHSITVDPAFTLPADADLVTAASVNMFAEGEANAIPWLYQRTGKYRFVDQYRVFFTGTPWVNYGGSLGTTAIAAWNTPQDISGDLFSGTFSGYVNPPGTATGDLLDVTVITSCVVGNTSGSLIGPPGNDVQVGIGVSLDSSSPLIILGSKLSLTPPHDTTGFPTGGSVYMGQLTTRGVATPGIAAKFGVHLMVNAYNGSSGSPGGLVVSPTGTMLCIVNHYRAN
jgi:hypothetical protein